MSIEVGVVQMNSSNIYEENMSFAELMMKQAKNKQIDIVTFPETFLFVGKDHQEKYCVAERLETEIIPRFSEMAIESGCSVLLGSVYELTGDDDERLYNTSIFLDADGVEQARYRKIHMCDAAPLGYMESAGIKPGEKTAVIDHETGRLGFTICYDLRFPDLFRSLSGQGAEIVFVPAAFFLHTGKHHWLPLLIARAIENQIYIVAPNQWGKHYDDRISYGSSVIIDPWGSVLCCSPETVGLTVASLDLNYLREVRMNMPLHTHRRPDLYI
ncbi:MAG TPA: carbon-nitrogen hydrolase family protein [Methylophaga aminisulfidivorans]|uniref:Carbon-nitrogen hydrolase family protein n=2 Tax=root TaxID=1 RepID=A0A7C2AJC6_9GAMM|nr:carbon-nitrogen hydrolase family protein [Methylophaga aminisulfidivorans]